MITRRLCDLHTHSTASDGMFAPADVLRLADAARLSAVALTDHDTIDGIESARRAAAEYPQLQFIAGIEFSAECNCGEMHILGLFIDTTNSSLIDMSAHMAAGRLNRNAQMIDRMRAAGIDLDTLQLLAIGGDRDGDEKSIGRAHFARLLVARKLAKSEADAFDKFLAKGRPFYVPRVRAKSGPVIDAIKAAGGVALLAHPVHLDYENYPQCERIIRSLVDIGLDGIEAYHSHHDDQQTRYFLELSRRWNLMVTGGSDFHGRYQEQIGSVKVPAMIADQLTRRAGAADDSEA